MFVAFQKRVTNREVADVSSGGHTMKNTHNAREGCFLLLSGVINADISEWLILADIYWLVSNNKNYQS